MTFKYTHDNDQVITALYLGGGTAKSIAARFGVTARTIYNILERQGIPRRRSGRQAQWEGNEQDRRDLVTAYEAGNGISVVARRFHISKRRATQVLQESGVTWRHPGGKRRFSAEDGADFARRYLAGETLTEIARRYEVSTQVIRNYLIRADVPLRPVGAPAFWTEERKAEAVRRYQAKEQLKDIAAAMGCGDRTLTRTLVELGVHVPTTRPRGENHHSWRGGRIVDGSGYVRVKIADGDRHLADGTRDSYMMEHRLVMARLLGRRLLKTETVHHINGNRQDNRPENLQLRQGRHGKGTVFRCAACGSHDIEAVPIEDDQCALAQ